MIPTDPDVLIRSVSLADVTEQDQLDERLSCLTVMFGATFGLNSDSVEWCPDDRPPTAAESIGWLWFCRPDLAKLLYTVAPDDLRELMVMYHHDRLGEWWQLKIERPDDS